MHRHALQHARAIRPNVDESLLQLVLVDDVVGQDLEPAVAWHDRASRVHEDKCVIIGEHTVRTHDVTLLDAPLELVDLGLEITFAHPNIIAELRRHRRNRGSYHREPWPQQLSGGCSTSRIATAVLARSDSTRR